MAIRTKRWNDPVEPGDGFRLLICRYRPRGVPKDGEPWDAWCPSLAPSPKLHADAYGKGGVEISWDEYTARFFEEMSSSAERFWIESYAASVRRGETLTLLCSSACVDETRCHRTLVRALLERELSPAPAPPPEGPRSGVLRRRRT